MTRKLEPIPPEKWSAFGKEFVNVKPLQEVSGSMTLDLNLVDATVFSEIFAPEDVDIVLYGPATNVPLWRRLWLRLTRQPWPEEVIYSGKGRWGEQVVEEDGRVTVTWTGA
jgi:hypothetical protein